MQPGKFMNFKRFLALGVFIISACIVHASDAPKELTLNECITIALINNPSILVAGEDMKKSLAEYRVARAQRLPFISFDAKSQQYPKTTDITALYYPFPQNFLVSQYMADQARSDNPLSDYYNLGISFGITAGISLYNEKKSRMQKTAKTAITMTKLNSRKTIADTILSVKQAYYSYTMAREYVVMREELLKSNEDRLKITRILYKNAQRPILDLSKAEYEFGDSQLELEKARNKERAARVELFRVMGVKDPGEEVVLKEYDLPGELRYSLEELNRH
ncbi:MAG: TolC family protein, partial [Chrysiogenales bacterium]